MTGSLSYPAWCASEIDTAALNREFRSALERSQVIVADNVAEHWYGFRPEEGRWSIEDDFPNIAPPFALFFIEFGRPRSFAGEKPEMALSRVFPHATGFFFDAVERDEGGWYVHVIQISEFRKGRPFVPLLEWHIDLNARGEVEAVRGQMKVNEEVRAALTDNPYADNLGQFIYPALMTLAFMHCKNVSASQEVPPDRLSRAHERRHGRPLTRYHVLDIQPMRRILDTEGEAQTQGLRHALHICRGHFKTFTDDAPLFGRHVGTYWWPSYARGSADHGVVEKDYRVRLDGDRFGQTYMEADEEVTVAPAKVKADDPDTSQRGLRAHNRSQNLLAQAVLAVGLSPRSPKSGEPDFDLAWHDGDTLWVAEVQSTTPENEERQMRLAIGQVIRYRQKLGVDRTDVRAMVAVENAPYDESWIDLCGREGIALVWPEVMALALGEAR